MRFPLLDRPGESLLVWTTTPWTLTSNVAAAVGPELTYVKVRQGDEVLYLSKGTTHTLQGPFEVLEERPGRELVGWRYRGPFDDLPQVQAAFAAGKAVRGYRRARPYEHRVVPWDEVGEDEGTGIVHIAPGCGAEDFQLGKALGPAGGGAAGRGRPLHRRVLVDCTGPGRGRRGRADHHAARGDRLLLPPGAYTHRYPHCWRCDTPLVFRVVDEWYINMGEAAPAADGRDQEVACATRSWKSSTRSPGSRASATSASSTGCAT